MNKYSSAISSIIKTEGLGDAGGQKLRVKITKQRQAMGWQGLFSKLSIEKGDNPTLNALPTLITNSRFTACDCVCVC